MPTTPPRTRTPIPTCEYLPGRRVTKLFAPAIITDARLVHRPAGPVWEYDLLFDHGGTSGGIQAHGFTPDIPNHPRIADDTLTVDLIARWLTEHPQCGESFCYTAGHLIRSVNRELRRREARFCTSSWFDDGTPVTCAFWAEPGTDQCGWHTIRGPEYAALLPIDARARPVLCVATRSHDDFVAHLLDTTMTAVMTDPTERQTGNSISARDLRTAVTSRLRNDYGIDLDLEQYNTALDRAVHARRIRRLSDNHNSLTNDAYLAGDNL